MDLDTLRGGLGTAAPGRRGLSGKRVESYRRESDPFAQFLDERTDEGAEGIRRSGVE